MDNAAENWYAPLENKAVPNEPKKKKGLPVGWRIAIWTLIAVALIVGSSVLFSRSAPEAPIEKNDDADQTDEDLPGNWRDYLDNYYTPPETSEGTVDLPKTDKATGFELELQPAPEKELSLQELYKQCADSIVAITGYVDGKQGYFWGTGIVLSEDGLILTNAHVVESCNRATVTLSDDSTYEASLVGADTTSDIAVLKIDATGLSPAQFGDSSVLTVGEHVAAIGNPLGESFRMTLTDGIISAIDRGVTYNGHSMTLLQTNTAINEGNSGGALFNMFGQVIGVTNMKMMSSYSSIEGIGFAIPSSTVRAMVNSLIQYGEVRGRTAVGITVGAIPSNIITHYELPEGLYVTAVSDGSDAKVKGILPGDIVTAVNGKPAKSTQDILDAKSDLMVGDSITFTIWREGKTFDVEVKLVDHNDIY